MPVGRYAVMDGKGRRVGTEEFRCAPGPAGWRYVSTIETSEPTHHLERLDLVVDDAWRFVRARIETGEHDLVLGAGARGWTGARDGDPLEVDAAGAVDLDYLSPSFNVVTANRLGETADIDVIYVRPVTLEVVRVRQRYELLGDDEVDTPAGRFAAARWRYTALGGGFTAELWVAEDVVVAYAGLFELMELEPGPRGPFPIG